MNIGIPELANKQIEDISQAAENSARKYIFSKLKQKAIENLTISIEAEGTKPINFTVEVDLTLSKECATVDDKLLTNQAVKEAFIEIENQLRKLK